MSLYLCFIYNTVSIIFCAFMKITKFYRSLFKISFSYNSVDTSKIYSMWNFDRLVDQIDWPLYIKLIFQHRGLMPRKFPYIIN